MSERAKKRAEDVAAMPHVQRWMKRLRKLSADMPPEVEAYVAAGTLIVLAVDPDEGSYMVHQGSCSSSIGDRKDQDALVDTIDRGRWDGGDW